MIGVATALRTIADWADAQCVGDSDMDMRHVCIDSRLTQPHSLFVALPGTVTDGHRYIDRALALPSTAAVICSDYYHAHRDTLHAQIKSGQRALLVVSDPLAALLRIAGRYLRLLSPPCRIAITGSSGKTTTKELLAAMIKQSHDVHYTAANRNSAIGIPLSLLQIEHRPDYLVTEVGTGYRGEIPSIVDAINPHIVVVTNIGHAHIEAFGTQQAIADEKLSLAVGSSALRTLYVHSSAERFVHRLRDIPQLCYYDRDPFALHISHTPTRGGAVVSVDGRSAHTRLLGAFQRDNICAAAVVAHHLGISTADIVAAIESYRPLFGRMQHIDGDIVVILDYYNANPESTVAVINYLQQMEHDGRKICVLGAMKELGVHSAQFHTDIFLYALKMKFDYLFCIGDEFSHLDFRAHPDVYHARDVDHASDRLVEVVRSGDAVLFKGSRGVQLERLAEHIHSLERVG